MSVDPFYSFTCAVILLILGKVLTFRIGWLRRWSIPEPVIGGFLCAGVVALLYAVTGCAVSFSLELRDFLLLAFFAGIGLKADIATLRTGGRPLLVLLALATGFIVIQNLVGQAMALAFGQPAPAGLMLGSVALTGGIGTALAWAPILSERAGIANALELGVAANTLGLIAACLMGGPVATLLMRRHAVHPSPDGNLDIGVPHESRAPRLDYFCVLWAMLFVNVSVMLGMGLHGVIAAAGVTLPAFVSCLFAGIMLRALVTLSIGRRLFRAWPGIGDGLALISDLALGLFLTMTLMGLQLWQLQGAFSFIAATLAVQIVLTLAFILFAVFPAMGRDYEAAVISAGFGGIALGSTATAIANMTAVTQQYGAAHRAFLIVPLVCGFFIDLLNALIIALFVG